MQYRTLGRTGLDVSVIGFGGGGIGYFWGTTNETESLRALNRAIDLGVNFFDMARIYRTAEEYLGKAVEGRPRSSVIIATKVQIRPEGKSDITKEIRESIDESLRQLRTDHVDILQLHNRVVNAPEPMTADLGTQDVLGPGGVLDAFRGLQQDGRVRYIGITGSGDEDSLREVIAAGEFDTIQVYYNIIHQNALGSKPFVQTDMPIPLGLLPLATEHRMGTIGIRSLAAGALTEQLDRPFYAESELARDVEKAQQLRSLVKQPIETLQQLAMLHVLMNEEIHTQVPGFKNVAEVEEAVACVDLPPISPEDVAEIDRLYLDSFGLT